MYAAELLLQKLTYHEFYYTLRSIKDEDCFIEEFGESGLLKDFLTMLEVYELAYITSDRRVLLTPKGDAILQYLAFKIGLENLI